MQSANNLQLNLLAIKIDCADLEINADSSEQRTLDLRPSEDTREHTRDEGRRPCIIAEAEKQA